jgi:hypothetical protein
MLYELCRRRELTNSRRRLIHNATKIDVYRLGIGYHLADTSDHGAIPDVATPRLADMRVKRIVQLFRVYPHMYVAPRGAKEPHHSGKHQEIARGSLIV